MNVKKIVLTLFLALVYSTNITGLSFNLEGTVSATGYGVVSFNGTGTFSLNSFKDDVVITASNQSSGLNKTGFFYWTDYFGTWIVRPINEHTTEYSGSGTFKTAGENIAVTVSRIQNANALKIPKTKVTATGKGSVNLNGQGTYSISKRVHDIALKVEAPTDVPLGQWFNATITLYNQGGYSEKTEVGFEFNYVGEFQGCSNTFGYVDISTPAGASTTSDIQLMAACSGPYEFKALAKNLDANPRDNNDSTRLNDGEYYKHDLAVTQILVPDQIPAGESFTPRVIVTNLGHFSEEARLGGFINPITNHECPITNMPLGEFTIQPGELYVYEYEPLSFTCVSEYAYSANLLNSDDIPENNNLQKNFEIIPAQNAISQKPTAGKTPKQEQTPLEAPLLASLAPFITALQKAVSLNRK